MTARVYVILFQAWTFFWRIKVLEVTLYRLILIQYGREPWFMIKPNYIHTIIHHEPFLLDIMSLIF